MKSAFTSILSRTTLCAVAFLCVTSSFTDAQAAPGWLFFKSTGRIGSISGTITWPKAGNTNASRTGAAYLAKVTPSSSPNTLGTTSLNRFIRPVPTFEPGQVVSRGTNWTQTYTIQKVPANQTVAVLIDPMDLKGIGPSSNFQRTASPEWATCTVGAPAATRFDYKMQPAIQ